MQKNLPWLISALVGASIASTMTWQMVHNKPELKPMPAASQLHQELSAMSFSSAIQKAAPAVVNFYSLDSLDQVKDLDSLPGSSGLDLNSAKRGKVTNLGSGVIFDASGFLITNNHVIKGAQNLRAVLHDGRDLPAEIIDHDPDTDLAVVRIYADNLPTLTIAPEDQTKTGDIVLAIGYPYGLGQAASMGIVSAMGRSGLNLSTFEDFIQTDAAINSGSSGGALINTRGEIIGISTAILTESGGSQGIGFAIPAHMALSIMEALIEDGRVKRGWLGILPESIDQKTAKALNLPPNTGILVAAIAPHTPASLAGFKEGDVIVRVGTDTVGDQHQALKAVAAQPPGSKVDIHIFRNGKPLILQVEVAERPQKN